MYEGLLRGGVEVGGGAGRVRERKVRGCKFGGNSGETELNEVLL